MKKLILISVLTLASSFALAHADHAPRVASCVAAECTKEQVQAAVPAALAILTEKDKLEKSWSAAKIEKVEQKQFKKGPEWVATLLDETRKEEKKKRLYIFITTKGFLNGANFTGE